ncbi:unnamed protein product [Caenorhabditis sp. 36 PRJEB53466]|nr:unnamed protein product [Caenorhabditis sp. 36 PRJEB53466]
MSDDMANSNVEQVLAEIMEGSNRCERRRRAESTSEPSTSTSLKVFNLSGIQIYRKYEETELRMMVRECKCCEDTTKQFVQTDIIATLMKMFKFNTLTVRTFVFGIMYTEQLSERQTDFPFGFELLEAAHAAGPPFRICAKILRWGTFLPSQAFLYGFFKCFDANILNKIEIKFTNVTSDLSEFAKLEQWQNLKRINMSCTLDVPLDVFFHAKYLRLRYVKLQVDDICAIITNYTSRDLPLLARFHLNILEAGVSFRFWDEMYRKLEAAGETEPNDFEIGPFDHCFRVYKMPNPEHVLAVEIGKPGEGGFVLVRGSVCQRSRLKSDFTIVYRW